MQPGCPFRLTDLWSGQEVGKQKYLILSQIPAVGKVSSKTDSQVLLLLLTSSKFN